MQGSKKYEGRLFYQITLDSLVPIEHLVRKLANAVDLGWVRKATAQYYSSTGKPSIDPVVIAKMMIIGFFYNISSERQLMREIQVNLAYRWYLGYDIDEAIPNHSVLSKARRRLGESFFEELFNFVLQLCRNNGLIDGSNVLIDSTLVKGNASTDSLTSLKYTPKQYFQQLESVTEQSGQQQRKDDELGSKRPREDRLCDQKQSITDPDATLVVKGKKTVLGYKTHVCADSHKGIITSVTVSTASADDTSAVPQLLDQHQQSLDKLPQRVVADGAYGSQDCLAYVQNKGIETVIKKRSGGNKHGGYDKSRFTYDSDKDIFICPAGACLKRVRTDVKKSKAHYKCQINCCRVCLHRLACLGEKSTASARTVTRFITPYENRAQLSCESAIGRNLLKLRHTLLEGLFGQAKSFHGLGSARWRGLGNMLIQSMLTAMVINLKKLLSCSGEKSIAASACIKGILQNYSYICRLLRTYLRLSALEASKLHYVIKIENLYE